jgi:hypothetical protein
VTTQTQQQNGSALATTQTGQAMAPTRQVSMGLAPTTLAEAWTLADALSRADLVPDQYRGKASNVVAAMFMAQDLGIGLFTAMREVYIVEGRPAASAALKVSLILQSGACEAWDVVESTDKVCTIRTKRRGKKEASLTLTMEEVTTAGFHMGKNGVKDTWKKYPRIMLRHRVESWLGDQEYPDIVRGLRTPEEIGEVVDAPVEPRVVAIPAQTAAVIPAAKTEPPKPSSDLPPLPKTEAPPHDPVTGEVLDEQPAQATTTAPSGKDPVDSLLGALALAVDEAEVDQLAQKSKDVTPKDHPRRAEVARAFSAKRTALRATK